MVSRGPLRVSEASGTEGDASGAPQALKWSIWLQVLHTLFLEERVSISEGHCDVAKIDLVDARVEVSISATNPH